MMTIGQRIAQKRKELGLSQENLGETLGVSRQSVYKWEADSALPEIDKLIAMSRLFGVTVGWLLGVEEETAAPGQQPERDGAELNEEQLHMVQEIVDRYISARQPKRKRRWPWVLGAAAVVVLIAVLSRLSGELDTLNSRYNNLQNAVSNISNSVNYQIGSIADRVEEILESQNSLLAGCRVEIIDMDIAENTLTISAKATPKTYIEGMETLFLVDTGDGPVEYPAALGEGTSFSAEITCALTDSTLVSVVFISGETRQTQRVEEYYTLYSSTFPEAFVETHDILMWRQLDENGNIVFNESTRGDNYAWLNETAYTAPLEWIETAEIREIKVGIFKNQKLVAWMEPCGQPDHFIGDWGSDQFYRVPDMTIVPGEGDIFTTATLVIDEYGREKLYMDAPFAVNPEENRLEHAESFVQEDWYNEETWSY